VVGLVGAAKRLILSFGWESAEPLTSVPLVFGIEVLAPFGMPPTADIVKGWRVD